MFCTECGTKVVGAGKFCANCGTKLIQPEQSVIEDAGKAANDIASSNMETDTDSIIQHAKEAYEKEDYNEAAKLLGVLVEQGNAEAQCMLGLCFYRPDTPKEDYPKAVKWFRLAAEQGYAEAQYYLGDCFHSGTGIEENKKEGIKWVRMAAEQGYVEAQYYLGYWHFCGDGVAEDVVEACKWYRKAAEQGHEGAKAQLMSLDCDYLHEAAEQGSIEAQYELGLKYLSENDIEHSRDKCEEAVKWLRKPAEQGYNNAHLDLGLAYYYLSVYDADYGKEAVKWLRLGAEQGDSESQRFLGQCYREGIGVKKSNSEAIGWFSKAAAQGHELAKTFIEETKSDEDDGDAEVVSSSNVIELNSIRQHHSERDNILALREEMAALIEEGNELLTKYSELIKEPENVSEALIVNNAQIENIEELKGTLTKLYDLDDVTDEFYENHMEVLEDKLVRLSELNQRIQECIIKQEKRGMLDKKLRDEFWNEVGDLSGEGGIEGFGMRFGKAFLNAIFKTARDDIREKQSDVE